MTYSIAIDGPAGAGKSTIAKKVAKALQFVYVDTGAMYRAMGLFLFGKGIPMEEGAVAEAAFTADISISYENGVQQVWLNGENVTGRIRGEEAGHMASSVSVFSPVREKLVQLQQKMALTMNVVMDGRDIGTVVLPKADVKIYLTASAKVRAKRRFLELTEKGEKVTLEEIQREIEERDRRDMTREQSPLKKAEDAILVDSSDLSIEEVAEKIISIFREKTGGN